MYRYLTEKEKKQINFIIVESEKKRKIIWNKIKN